MLKIKRLIIDNKILMLYSFLLLLLLFLLVVLLYENAYKTLYFVCVSTAFSSLIIGQNNSISIFKLGLGMTRKEIEKKLISELLLLIIYSLILIAFDILFIYIVLGKIEIQLRVIIFTFLTSLILSLLAVLIRNNYKNIKLMIFLLLTTITIIALLIWISNQLISNIVLIFVIVIMYYINRYNIYHKQL